VSYQQLQSWPTPEIFVNSLPSAAKYLTYDAPTCREDLIFTIPSLSENTLYSLQIGSSAAGPWFDHIEFALVTLTEQASKTKVLRLNNDYNGTKFFRLLRTYTSLGPEATVLAGAVQPLASAIPAPTISVAALTELTSATPPTRYFGLLPLNNTSFTPNGDIAFVKPISGNEDPTCWNSSRYVRPYRKYAGAYLNNNFAHWADLNSNQSIANAITLTGTGARYTIDGSDPAIDTPQYAYDGVPNNAYAISPAFKCIIRARSFSGSCRSPLAIVVIDKVSPEVEDITTTLIGGDVVDSCDLERVINGATTISSQNCAGQPALIVQSNVWPRLVLDTAIVPPQPGNIPFDGSAQPMYYSISYALSSGTDYLGWTFSRYSTLAVAFTAITWAKPTSNNYFQVAPLHTYFQLEDSGDATASPVVPIQKLSLYSVYTTVGGNRDVTYFNSPTFAVLNGFLIADGGLPASTWPVGGLVSTNFFTLRLNTWDLVWTPFHAAVLTNYVAAIVTAISGGGVPVAPNPLPGPQPPDPRLLVDIEPWDEYALTNNADIATLDQGNGFAVTGWVVKTFISPIGLEPWESYTLGTITLDGVYYSGPDATRSTLNSGDGFDNLSGWLVPDSLNIIGLDDMESYPLGAMDSYNFNGGSGFASGYVVWPDGADGFEDWESWPVGVITPAILAANGLSGQGMSGVPWVIWIL